jgi:Ca-activated chloride channel family protein
MSFIWPAMLLSLLLIPLLIVLYLRLQKRRQRLAANFSNLGLLQTGSRTGVRRQIPPVLFLIGLAVLLFTLARPEMEVTLPKREGTVILAFDVSGSMAATDLVPNRMEAAKAAAQEFVQRQPLSVSIGVVAFSDSGFSIQVPTNDQTAILDAITRLAPQRGTSLGQGILASLNAIVGNAEQEQSLYSSRTATPEAEPQVIETPALIVLFSDGENNIPPDPREVAQAAAERGVRIYPVGIGSAAGTTLEVEGFTVHTQLDEEMLQQIAQISEGAYYRAESQQDLETIYQDVDMQLVMKPEKTELTALLAGLGTLILLIGAGLSLFWFGRVP